MRYEIKGTPFPVVICQLEDGEQMVTERGSMVWMSPNMEMQTHGGGLGRMFSKMFSGESMFQNIYTAHGAAEGEAGNLPQLPDNDMMRMFLKSMPINSMPMLMSDGGKAITAFMLDEYAKIAETAE